MGTYIDTALAALVAIYVVDVSGFTDSWRDGLARLLHVRTLRPLPPFDCGTCMAWWTALAYGLTAGGDPVLVLAESALLSLLALPIGQTMILIREWITAKISARMP